MVVVVVVLRHFKHCGRLALPQQQAARVKQMVGEVLPADVAEVQYPNWRAFLR